MINDVLHAELLEHAQWRCELRWQKDGRMETLFVTLQAYKLLSLCSTKSVFKPIHLGHYTSFNVILLTNNTYKPTNQQIHGQPPQRSLKHPL